MTGYSFFYRLEALLLFLIHLAVIARVILRPRREPASSIAWIVMIIALPVVGMIAYLFLGETNIGRRRRRRIREVLAGMPRSCGCGWLECGRPTGPNPGAL
ncbi:MAG TPA: PLDc N-terminal domain-containing protein [Terrimicrobiaceae bacterium]|jgi:cardiolipin synthase|nr:PLDc N-terminal domain-containing protein [Terrimicrobiaceae bacterium]